MAISSNDEDFLIVVTTCSDQKTAEQIASQVISNCLAGCVNILPNLTSVYRWQGKIEKEREHLLIIKTHGEYYSRIEDLLKKIHPYEVPEIIAIPINRGSLEYLTWLKQCLN